jgi:hypothetical protein
MGAHAGAFVRQIAGFVDVKAVPAVRVQAFQIQTYFYGGVFFQEFDGAADFVVEHGNRASHFHAR